MSIDLITNVTRGSFKLYKLKGVTDILDIYNSLVEDRHAASLSDLKPGFENVHLHNGFISFVYRNIIESSVKAIKDGRVKEITFHQAQDCTIAMTKNFAIITGQQGAAKIATFTVNKHTSVDFAPVEISPVRLHRVSAHMSQIRSLSLHKLDGDVKKAVFSGAIESMADLDAFGEVATEKVRTVKGVIQTIDGVRTLSVSADGKIQLGLTKEEKNLGINGKVLTWVYDLIFRATKAEVKEVTDQKNSNTLLKLEKLDAKEETDGKKAKAKAA